jgi:hypothetical protein
MGEIKSTWDIVMEKTKGLKISSGDRERIKRGQLASRANNIFHRYMDTQGNPAYLQKELQGLGVEEREVVRRELLLQLLDAIELSRDNRKVITGIETLKGKPVTKTVERLNLLASEYRASMDEKSTEIGGIFLHRLADRGISGSAVVPSLEGKREWTDAMEGLQRDYGNRLEALKEALLSS